MFDQLLNQSDAQQTLSSLQPSLCSKRNRINNSYYLLYNGSQRMISDIDLNPTANEQDLVNIFIVYKIMFYSLSYWCANGLFGHNDMGFNKVISFSHNGDLVVSSTVNDHIVIGQNNVNGRSPLAPYKTKANAGLINKWICLSCHWYLPSVKSYVYCNGRKLIYFISNTSLGSNQMTFGDINPSDKVGFLVKLVVFYCIRIGV